MINKFLLSVTPAPTGGNKLYTWGGGTGINTGTTAALGLGTSVRASSPTQVGSENWSAISTGASHTIAIKSDGTLWAWGFNNYGQLAYDDKVSWSMIATGQAHGLGIKPDGSLWAVGSGLSGELGNGFAASTIAPIQIGTSSWTMVKVSNNNSYAIRSDGGLFTWGSGGASSSLIGDGTTISRSSPVQIGTSSWSMVSASNSHVMAIRTDGTLWGWGSNTSGQLGPQGNDTTSWIMAAASSSNAYSFGIKSDGTMWAWGFNNAGQLGDGTTINKSSPVQIGAGNSWTMISSGPAHRCAIATDGTLWAWGSNGNGQLGDGTTITRSSPVQIGTSSWTMVSASTNGSGRFTLAIRSDGTLWAWGSNAWGQLGDGTTINKSSPIQIGTGNSWTTISAGSFTAFAIYTNATNPLAPITTLWSWGYSAGGQLGIGVITSRSSPVQIGTAADSWTKVNAGGSSQGAAGAIKANGTLWTWGRNDYGALGNSSTISRSSPVQVGSDTNWKDVVINGDESSLYGGCCALKTDGSLWTWGTNISGQLGNGTTTNRSSPVQIGIGYSWTKIAIDSHLFAITSTGELYGCGINANFALQTSLTSSPVTRLLKHGSIPESRYSSPVQIGTASNWSYVDCTGGTHALGIQSDGSLWSWGTNGSGMGNSDYGVIPSPQKIGSSSWSKVAVGGVVNSTQGQSFAIRSDGTMWAWGANDSGGVLGINLIGTGNSRSSPVQIGAANTWSNVFGSSIGHYYAITTNGMLYAWGGQQGAATSLGDGSNSMKSSPIQIGTSSWSMVSAGRETSNSPHNAGITADGKGFWWGSYISTPWHGAPAVTESSTTPRKFLTYLNQSSPVQIGTSSWTKISAGQDYSAAIRSDGTLWAWGRNLNGRLGNNSTITEVSPVQIGTSSWSMVSCGYSAGVSNSGGTTGAIRSDGALFMWGGNSQGQIGDGSTIARSSPVQIGTSSWTMVSCTLSHTAAIRSDGALFTWGGSGLSGLFLGDGSTVARLSPVQVGASSWTMAVTSYSGYTMAIRSDNTLWAWGSADSGQLGDNTIISRSLPVQIGTSSWNKVSVGQSHTLAVRSDGTIWGWGSSTNWQLGTGTTASRSSPVQIGTLGSWNDISAGQFHSAALRNE